MFLNLSIIFLTFAIAICHPQEKSLLRNLLHDYESRIIPDSIDPLEISNDMRIYILVGVDEQQESIRLLLWSAQRWNDSGLKWNSTAFDGIEEINIPAENLWLPDWHIFNLVDSKDSVELSRTNARVNFRGEVAVDFYKVRLFSKNYGS
uniref:Neurotransmitter-gated ion-channel ligand-binding domain-containing protein n=1 Tax=Panagrolaimus sp. ES5 TaxID=591445 RepID=A0AC34F5Y4_9BILA